MNCPKITIITPTYNCDATLEETIKSVVNQTYNNIEYILVDGSSADRTLEIIKSYCARFPQIRYISEKDEGIYDAMNKGINMAEGEYLYFLGADDTLYGNEVVKEIFHDKRLLKYDIIYGNVIFRLKGIIYDGRFTAKKILKRNICHQGIFTRRNVFDKLGRFNIKYKALADYNFNLKWISSRQIKSKYIDKIIAVFFEDGFGYNFKDVAFGRDFNGMIKDSFGNFFYFKHFVLPAYLRRFKLKLTSLLNEPE